MHAMLRCRFRGPASLMCRMTDSTAVSFTTKATDPNVPGEPMPETTDNHPEYQIAEEAFQITFTPNGIGKILVNRTVSPADLNIIRAVVNQLNLGTNIARKRETQFNVMEKSMIGMCDTTYHIIKNSTGAAVKEPPRVKGANCSANCKVAVIGEGATTIRSTATTTENENGGAHVPWDDSDYKLSGLESLARKRGESLRLEKWRNVYKCSLRADYFFGSRESFCTDPNDFEARIVDSESSIYVSDTNFASYTSNELHIKRQHGEDLTIYERYTLSLASIDAAEPHLPVSIVDPASASLYAYQYIDDDEESAEMRKRARTTRLTTPRILRSAPAA